jgi:hypothetical protein
MSHKLDKNNLKPVLPRYENNHGYETQSKLWKHSAASCGALYPPLRGIVQLTNSATLRFRNWSFTIKIFIVLLVCPKYLYHMLNWSSIFDYFRLKYCMNWENKKNNVTGRKKF